MKILLSFIEWRKKAFEYKNMEEFRTSLKALGLDGLELVSCGEEVFIPRDLVHGIHLPFFTSWLDYYLGNFARVREEFGSLDLARDFFKYQPEDLYKYFLPDLNHADQIGAYAVFHVANTNGLEYLSQDHYYSDVEVIDASARLINTLLDNSKFDNFFLMENLYIPGLKFTDLDLTKRLLDKIEYKNKGFVLDVGHLMCTNTKLRTEDQAWDYVDKILDLNREIIYYIKVVHLHVSTSGEIIEAYKNNPPDMDRDFYKRFEEIYRYVGMIDTHSIAKSDKCRRVIEKINPDYLVLEFKYSDRKDMEEKTRMQMECLKK